MVKMDALQRLLLWASWIPPQSPQYVRLSWELPLIWSLGSTVGLSSNHVSMVAKGKV